jgi:nitronate monooxygenase
VQTELTTLLGIRHPVLLAPMAGVSGAALARAVTRAGGLDLLGGGYGDRAWLSEQLALCAGEPFGVGFITWALQRHPELLDLALAAQPRAVMLSFGELAPFADAVRAAAVPLIALVQTLRQACTAAAQGAQGIVAQGSEAGGHGGLRGTFALVPAVVDAVAPLRVVADGRGLAAALLLGASGVLCGTAFYACDESLAHDAAKRALVCTSGDDTLKSALFDRLRGLDWPAGPWSLRTLRNAYARHWAEDLDALERDLDNHQQQLREAHERGDFDIAPVIAGEAADLVRPQRPAAEVLHEMIHVCAERLRAVRNTHLEGET